MSPESKATSIATAEQVHVVWDYVDGPRAGIADFQGRPHAFKCQFSDAADDWTDHFWLMEIDRDLLRLALDQHAIFVRWKTEFDRGTAAFDSHPALPADRARYEALEAAIKDRFQIEPERSITQRGRFSPRCGSDDGIVQWIMP
jgi:hypothetical protein